jgi:hypothetical protein
MIGREGETYLLLIGWESSGRASWVGQYCGNRWPRWRTAGKNSWRIDHGCDGLQQCWERMRDERRRVRSPEMEEEKNVQVNTVKSVLMVICL